MRVWIRDVESIEHPRTGKRRHTIFWTFARLAHASDGQCHTWSDWEASLCQRAKDQYQTVELETESTAWGPRVQAVSLSQPNERTAVSA